MGLKRTIAPTLEPVTLTQAKTQCSVAQTHYYHDDFLKRAITDAIATTERITRRAWLTQTWALTLEGFPGSQFGVDIGSGCCSYRCIQLPRPPLASVTSIAYVDTDEASQTWASSNYNVRTNSSPGIVSLAATKSWPTTSVEDPEAVTITYVAGDTAAASVPVEAKQAILALVEYRFKYRDRSDVPQFIMDKLSGLHCGMKMGAYGVTA